MSNKALRGLADFRTAIKTRSLARTERFEVEIALSKVQGIDAPEEDVLLFCEEVQIPGMVLSNKEFNVGPWTFFRNTNMGFLGNEINITFLTDNEWKLRSTFEQWMAKCVDPRSKEIGYIDNVSTTIKIKALELEQGNQPHGGPETEANKNTGAVSRGRSGWDAMLRRDPETGSNTPVGSGDWPMGGNIDDVIGGRQKARTPEPARVTKEWTLFECMPKVLNLVPLSMGTTSVIRTTLIISAAYWESKDIAVEMGKG